MARKIKNNAADVGKLKMFIPGVSNYSKLLDNQRDTKSQKIHKFSPFSDGKYTDTTRKNLESESSDERYLDEDLYLQMMMSGGLFGGQAAEWGKKGKKGNFFTKGDYNKRDELIKFSSYDKLHEILSKLSDEVIVTKNGERFAEINIDTLGLDKLDLDPKFVEQLSTRAAEVYDFIYNCFGFRDEGSKSSAWSKMYQYLVEGTLGYELVYNDINNPKKIIGIVEVDPLTYTSFWQKGIKYWSQEKKLSNREKNIILYDTQLVFTSWADASLNNRYSYLEGLIRSFNVSRVMEEAKIIWHVTNSQFRTLFVIPTRGKSRIKAAQTLASEQQRHRDDTTFDYESGELEVNGMANQEFQKQYFVSDGDSGRPDIQALGGEGPDLSDTASNEYFDKKLYRNSMMPQSRFDQESGSTWNMDTQSRLREEISTGRFVNRIRAQYGKTILKPVLMQLCMDFPEIADDASILSAISLKWNSYSVFEELMEIEVLREKIGFIEDMRDSLVTETSSGDTIPFWSMKFLVEKYMSEISEEDLKLNEKYADAELVAKYENMKKLWKLEKEFDPEFDEELNNNEGGGFNK